MISDFIDELMELMRGKNSMIYSVVWKKGIKAVQMAGTRGDKHGNF
jgi:hypothetical protein